MISVAWAIFKASPIARWLAKIGGLVLLVLTFGAYQRRQGAQIATASRDAADAKETTKAHEVRDEVEDRIVRGGSAKQRLKDRWSR